MIINYKNDIDLSTFVIVFKGSTMLEHKGNYGTSHLIEHLLCKSFDHLQDNFQRYDISWNAYTSNENIVFYIKGLDKYINEYKYELLDLILNYIPNEEDFNKEKNIIIEEYLNSFNEQLNSHLLNLERKLFNYYSPIGLLEDIKNYSYNECINTINKYYKKPSQIINISKNNPFKNEIDLSNKNLSKHLKYKVHNVQLELNNNFNNSTSIVLISPLLNNINDYPYINMITTILGDGLNSPLYQEIREKNALVYYIHSYMYDITPNQYAITFATETSNDNVNTVINKIKDILNNKNKYLTKERFNIVKDNIKIKKIKNNILIHNNFNKFINPKTSLLENMINEISFNKINKIYNKYFNIDNYYISIYNEEFKKK